MPATKEYWKLVLENLENTIPITHYNAWFSKLKFVNTKNAGKEITLSTFSKFAQKYIEDKYNPKLLTIINKYYPGVLTINFEIDNTSDKKSNKTRINLLKNEDSKKAIEFYPNQELESDNAFGINIVKHNLPSKGLSNLNPKYTFETFVHTSNNELIISVAKIVSQKPGTQYNPVFVYSGTGLGKTHILQAIGHKTQELHPNFNIKYITSETFVGQYIEAVSTRKMKDFNEFYRKVDLLLVDDIHFIAGKEATQEAFFHMFNILHQGNKQIVVSSDKHPKNLGGMEQRLISRFEWGIVIDISKPNFEDRYAVINFKLNQLGIKLTESQIVNIAQTVDTNYRDIEGVLNRISARFQLLPEKYFLDSELQQILTGFKFTNLVHIDFKPKIKSFEQILGIISQTIGVDQHKILGSNREKPIALARQLTMYVLKQDLNYSYSAISNLFHKSHSTVIHSVEKIEKVIYTDTHISSYINLIRQNYPK